MPSVEHILGSLVLFVAIRIALSSRYKPALGLADKHGLWGPFSLNYSTQPWLPLPSWGFISEIFLPDFGLERQLFL